MHFVSFFFFVRVHQGELQGLCVFSSFQRKFFYLGCKQNALRAPLILPWDGTERKMMEIRFDFDRNLRHIHSRIQLKLKHKNNKVDDRPLKIAEHQKRSKLNLPFVLHWKSASPSLFVVIAIARFFIRIDIFLLLSFFNSLLDLASVSVYECVWVRVCWSFFARFARIAIARMR